MIQFTCPHCNSDLRTPNGSGKAARCPNCLALIEVPRSCQPPAPFPDAEAPAAGLSATAASVSAREPASDPLDPQRPQGQGKRNFVLLGLAATGLVCAGFMIVDFITKSNALPEPRRNHPQAIVDRRMGPSPPMRPPPLSIPQPMAQVQRIKVRAQTQSVKPLLRLGNHHFRHGGIVSALAVSSGTNLLASCGMDGQIRIWNARTGEAVQRLSGGGEPLQYLALSRDGRWVAAGSQWGMLYIWEVPTGRQAEGWRNRVNNLQGIALATDGRTLASLGFVGPDYEICLWRVAGLTKLWSWRGDARGLFLSPDGKTLATFLKKDPAMFSLPGGSVLLLDADTGRERLGIAQPEDLGVGLAFSPDGRTLAIGGRDGVLRLWDMTTGKVLHSFEGHSGMIFHVAFSPDGRTLASVGSDVRLWDVASHQQQRRLPCAGYSVTAISFSEDGRVLYTGGDDHAIHRWDTATGEELLSDEGQGAVAAVAIAPDGKTAVTAGKDTILHFWDLTTGKPSRQLRGHQRPVQCVAFSADGRFLASAAGQRGDRGASEVRLWDVTTGQELKRWDGSTYSIGQVRFLPGDRALAALESHEGQVHIWDTASGKERHYFGDNPATCSSFSPDGALLAVRGLQGMQLWNVATGRPVGVPRPEIGQPFIGNLQGNRGILFSTQALSPGGKYLACASRTHPGIIQLFNVATGEAGDLPAVHVVTGPAWREPVAALAWSHDGKTLASGGGDGQVWLWDLDTENALPCGGHEGPVTALAFSSDDRMLISGSDDTTALVWDLAGVREASKKSAERPWP